MSRRRKGSILVVALWSVALLSVFAVTLGYEVRQKITLVSRLSAMTRLRQAAEAGAKRAALQLRKEKEHAYYSLQDEWSNDPNAFRDVRVGEASFTVSYRYPNDKSGGTVTRYGLRDESSKININVADRFVIQRLVTVVLDLDEMPAQELAASIVDWRDEDGMLSIPLGSAEDQYYEGLKYPYKAKNAPFEKLEELLLVKGMTEDLLEKLKAYITIEGDGRVNANTAPRAVMLALGIAPETVTKIIDYRYGKDEIPGTGDDGNFITPGDIVPNVSQFSTLAPSELPPFTAAVPFLTTVADRFSATSVAASVGGRYAVTVTAVFDRTGKVLSWQES